MLLYVFVMCRRFLSLRMKATRWYLPYSTYIRIMAAETHKAVAPMPKLGTGLKQESILTEPAVGVIRPDGQTIQALEAAAPRTEEYVP